MAFRDMKIHIEAHMTNSIKMDPPHSYHTDKRAHALPQPDDPGPEDKDNFEKAMSEQRDGKSFSEGDDEESGMPAGQAMPSASSLLGSLFASKMDAIAAPAPAAVNLDELVDGLVQRILVSDPKTGGPAEIQLQLNDSVLSDTQITLRRDPDGLLSILLATGNAASMQTLVSARQSLHDQLEKHGPVSVSINETKGNGQSDNDANRRSQTLVEYGPDTL